VRALTAKEKKLLVVLLAALFFLLNVVGLQAFLNRQRQLQSNIAQLQIQGDEARSILADRDYWQDRAAWLDENQPVDDITTIEDDVKFTEFVETSARNAGLEYTRRAGGTLPPVGPYVEVYDASTVKGTMESLVKWLSELQDPRTFRAIKQLRIRSAPEPPGVVCEIEVARWYLPVGEVQP
jgi:hypothetical protein